MTRPLFAAMLELVQLASRNHRNEKEMGKMNKSRLIGGIICLTLAVLLAVLTFVLPENQMMFMVATPMSPLSQRSFWESWVLCC